MIVQTIQQQQPPGRFIKLSVDNCDSVWTQITYDQAVYKTRQALSEKDQAPHNPLNRDFNHLIDLTIQSNMSYNQLERIHQLYRQQKGPQWKDNDGDHQCRQDTTNNNFEDGNNDSEIVLIEREGGNDNNSEGDDNDGCWREVSNDHYDSNSNDSLVF